MLKVIVYDSGYGGELFADRLEEDVPVLDVTRVIDWRNSEQLLKDKRTARRIAENALKPYFYHADLIIFANHLLTITSLKYFRHKYKRQKFIGLDLKESDTFLKRDILILTTKAVSKTIGYHIFLTKLKRKTKTLTLDDWPEKIDDGELTEEEIRKTLGTFLVKEDFLPEEVILACSQFNDIKKELKRFFGQNVRLYDSFDDALRETCRTLKLRGGIGKKD